MGSFASAFSFPFGGDDAPVADTITLAFDVETGAQLTYEWRTDVMSAWSGKEQRVSLLERPRQRFQFRIVLDDDQYRRVIGQIGRNAPDGVSFQLALAHECATVAEASGFDVTLHSLVYSDWAVDGQRVVVVGAAGIGTALIVEVNDETLTLDTDLSAIAVSGSRVMPVVPVYLDAQQALSRYAVNAGEWMISAVAASFRYGTVGLVGNNASLTSFESLTVWDVGIQSAQASQPLHSGVDVQDLGFRVDQLYRWDEAQWGRAIRIESAKPAHWQWLKLFLHTVRGRARAFLLPSGRPDLVPVSDASSGSLTISSANNYVTNWWPSLAHRRLKLVTTTGAVAYRSVSSAIDNGDGTQTLTLSAPLAGALARVEFLELVRLDSDDVAVTWPGGVMTCELVARVTQSAELEEDTDYESLEISVQDGTPVELYTFTLPSGIYRLTSAAEDVTFSGETYTSIPMSRGNVVVSQVGQAREIQIKLGIEQALVQDFIRGGMPPKTAQVTIWRIHDTAGSARQIWIGEISVCDIENQWVHLVSPSLIDRKFSVSLPVVSASRVCNHALYDAGCTIDKIDYTVPFCTVVSANGTTIVVSSVGSHGDNWAQFGELVRDADGEARDILEQIGTTITIDAPFRVLNPGDSLRLRAGCDHKAETCRDKFSNIVNFGGHPDLPTIANPQAPTGYGVIVQS